MAENKKRWYIVSTQSGKEREIMEAIKARAVSYDMTNYIFDSLIVEHEVPVMRNGKETGKTVMKNKYPRYIYVQMDMTDEAWYVVRNTPGVTGIIGSSGKGTKPIPVPEESMKDVLRQAGKYDSETASKFQEGQKVFILGGIYMNHEGVIINVDSEGNQANVEIQMGYGKTATGTFPFSDIEPLK